MRRRDRAPSPRWSTGPQSRPREAEVWGRARGLDIAGDEIMEIDVFSPGGLHSIERLEKVTFCDRVIESLEEKIAHGALYRPRLGNRELAVP